MTPPPQELAPGLVFCQRGWLSANHFVFSDGDDVTLLDSGYLDQADETLALLIQVGVDPARVGRVISSHVHCDHVGGHAILHARSGCRIAMSAACRLAVERKDAWASWPAYYGQAYRFFPVHETLAEGDVLRLAGLDWQVLELPGHAAGQLGFFCPDNGWLISADAAWAGDFGVLTLRIEGWDAPLRQRESLRRLAALPLKRILPGHGPLIDDPVAAIARCRERVELFIHEPRRLAEDQVRKILLYHLLMKGPIGREDLWHFELGLPWLAETCVTWLVQPPREVFDRFLDELIARGLVAEHQGRLCPRLPA